VDASQVRVLLLDIEGTTTPIDFVYKTLFPYASRRVESYLREHSAESAVHSLIGDLRGQHATDQSQGLQPPAWCSDTSGAEIPSASEYVRWLIARDSKCTPLKSLQGKIWQEGFDSGELHGEVYVDVPPALARWRRQGREICIYSSGSVLAQKLLFQTVKSGDLTPQITAFFDTQTGIKTAAESYRRIAATLSRKPSEFLFVSDAQKEIDAARTTGMHALLCDRETPESATTAGSSAVHTFDEILAD
jgi:enolase-phosphatase E1